MAFPRMSAALFVMLLIGVVSLAAIFAVMTLGPAMAHGTSVQHVNGKILQMTGSDRDFILMTPEGTRLQFECRATCRASAGHLDRHIIEKANTDVYFQPGPNNTLLVIDVD
ncbi:MAG: hypothetical protein JO011_08015 [Ktedonobacteraceae bacterium]|nr:hypothetical protein [Ktedonobacteraceae bacterium]